MTTKYGRFQLALTLFSFVTILAGWPTAVHSKAAQEVTLHYHSRQPYQMVQDGFLAGLVGAPAAAAFAAAGIPYAIIETPSARQIMLLKENSGLDCAIGWFKNPERETFAKFTLPIYQDEPQIALTAAAIRKITVGDSLEAVLANNALQLLVKSSYSYGKELDTLIEKHQPNRQMVSGDNLQMFKMIDAGRADYMFVGPEEAKAAIPAAGFALEQFHLVKLTNMPPGEKRYILCSKLVQDEIIARLNAVIRRKTSIPK